MVVKIMVPFWVPSIVRHQVFFRTEKGTIILTTTHMDVNRCGYRDLETGIGVDIGMGMDMKM